MKLWIAAADVEEIRQAHSYPLAGIITACGHCCRRAGYNQDERFDRTAGNSG